MFISPDIVSVVFRIINFSALVGISFYVFQKYIKKNLFDLIEDKKNNHDFLCAQQVFLEKQQLELDAQVKSEVILCEKFKANIDHWRDVVLSEQDQQKEKQAIRAVSARKRHEIIIAHEEDRHIQDIVTEMVADHLQQSLSVHFENAQKKEEYLNGIIDFMNERKL